MFGLKLTKMSNFQPLEVVMVVARRIPNGWKFKQFNLAGSGLKEKWSKKSNISKNEDGVF